MTALNRAEMQRLIVPAPAKVNLFLHVTGRREDGYHTLESLIALIDLADTITLERRDDGVIRREGDVAGVPEERGIYFALRSYTARRRTGTSPCVQRARYRRLPTRLLA